MKANRLKRIIQEEIKKLKRNKNIREGKQMLTEAEFECCNGDSSTDIECCTAILCNCCKFGLNCCEAGYNDCTEEELNPPDANFAPGGGSPVGDPRAAEPRGQMGEQKGGCGCNKNKR